MKFATKPVWHYPPHLRHVATLPRVSRGDFFETQCSDCLLLLITLIVVIVTTITVVSDTAPRLMGHLTKFALKVLYSPLVLAVI